MWTTDLPTVAGQYWYRTDANADPRMASVIELDAPAYVVIRKALVVTGLGVAPLMNGGQWNGPIQPPP